MASEPPSHTCAPAAPTGGQALLLLSQLLSLGPPSQPRLQSQHPCPGAAGTAASLEPQGMQPLPILLQTSPLPCALSVDALVL